MDNALAADQLWMHLGQALTWALAMVLPIIVGALAGGLFLGALARMLRLHEGSAAMAGRTLGAIGAGWFLWTAGASPFGASASPDELARASIAHATEVELR